MKNILLSLLLLMLSCKSDVKETKEYQTLLRENKVLKEQIEDLKNTPEMRVIKAEKLSKEEDYQSALVLYNEIIKNFPGTEFSDRSEIRYKEISEKVEQIKKEEARIAAEKIEEEKRKRELGFKILKPKLNIKLEDLTLKFSSIQFKNSFVFDSYDDRYHYLKASRGNKYLTARVTITSESKNPKLPVVLAYILENGKLIKLSYLGLDYKFRRWEDYGSYLGNNPDLRNDFEYTATIPFNLGYEVTVDKVKGKTIFLVLNKNRVSIRKYERFENPPTSYDVEYTEVKNFKNELVVDDFDSDGNYILIGTIKG